MYLSSPHVSLLQCLHRDIEGVVVVVGKPFGGEFGTWWWFTVDEAEGIVVIVRSRRGIIESKIESGISRVSDTGDLVNPDMATPILTSLAYDRMVPPPPIIQSKVVKIGLISRIRN
jgi:hypothetical protein